MDKTQITAKAPPPTVSATAITANGPAPSGPHMLEASEPRSSPRKAKHPLWRALEVLASLRLTVVLFVLSFILVFYGTWAQVDLGVWTVVDKYFRSIFVWIPVNVIFLRLVDSNLEVLYPGGWLLGGVLLANLLAAHAIRFKMTWKRSGIFFIHVGIILMMLGEFVTGMYAVEGRMHIKEGETVNYVQHDRFPELAVVDPSNADFDEVVSVPTTNLVTGKLVSHGDLPFDIHVDDYMVNSALLLPDDSNPATAGHGQKAMAQKLPEVSGTDPNQTIDYPSAYITVQDKKNGKNLGTYLVSYHFLERVAFKQPQMVTVDGKAYEIVLRPRRSYRSYQIKLIDFRHDRYMGTDKAKNFQSDVLLIDPERKENRKVTISMNNPLRYAGETFYQASFSPDERGTVLQVVRNWGWWMPYASCLVVTLGMLIHFGINLVSFLEKRMGQ